MKSLYYIGHYTAHTYNPSSSGWYHCHGVSVIAYHKVVLQNNTFCFKRQSNKFILKLMLDVEMSLCSYMFRCKDPTYNPSSTRLFFMFVTFSLLIILVRTLDIASVLYLAVTVPLITSVNFTSARTFGTYDVQPLLVTSPLITPVF